MEISRACLFNGGAGVLVEEEIGMGAERGGIAPSCSPRILCQTARLIVLSYSTYALPRLSQDAHRKNGAWNRPRLQGRPFQQDERQGKQAREPHVCLS